jgi:hypothetical protein
MKINRIVHPKDVSNLTLREIRRISIMECDDPERTDEIQRLCREVESLISIPWHKENLENSWNQLEKQAIQDAAQKQEAFRLARVKSKSDFIVD